MAKITTAAELAKKAIEVAKNYKTLYIMGCFGAPMNIKNKSRYCSNNIFNTDADRTAMINAATDDTFGFDCVGLIKGLLWGWSGDKSKTYGGAEYKANDVPDIGADAMIGKCVGVSTDFSKIEIGEAVWCEGHIGIYVGDGLAVECTPSWKNCVQITACNCTKTGYVTRNWKKHGKLPYVCYVVEDKATASKELKVGDVVTFTGKTHYKNATALLGSSCKPGRAKITAISKGKKHPYHLVNVSGGGSTVYGWVNAADISGAVTATEQSTASWTPKIGDTVMFTGKKHYKNATAMIGSSCKPGRAKITATASGKKHPYHLVRVSGSGATVYGWVDAGTFTKA